MLVASWAGACGTVHRYEADEGAESPPTRPLNPTVHAHPELGDGTVAGELLAGARRLVGLRFGDEDATLASEQDAFEAHLAAIAVWPGGVAAGRGAPGELWFGPDGRWAVIEASLGGGRWRVIGPVEGEGGVRVRTREVSGGAVRRAVAGEVAG